MVTIGWPIETYEVYLLRAGKQGFVIEWYNDHTTQDPRNDINGHTLKMIIGDRENPVAEYSAVAVNNTTTFNISEADSDLEFDLYDGLIVQVTQTGETPLVDLKVHVEPS